MIRKRIGCGTGLWAALFLASAWALPAGAQDEPPAEGDAAPAGEAPPAEDANPWKLYLGLDQDSPTISFSDPALRARFGAQELDSSMLRLRAGVRMFDFIGLELHIGSGSEDGDQPGKFDVGSYAGLFLVPTGVLFDVIEVAGLVGITRLEAERGAASETFDGQAYGVNVELPLRLLFESLPDLRVGGGYIIYDHNNQQRIYGAHLGLRFDFSW